MQIDENFVITMAGEEVNKSIISLKNFLFEFNFLSELRSSFSIGWMFKVGERYVLWLGSTQTSSHDFTWRKRIHNLNIFLVRSQSRILNSRGAWISLKRWYEFLKTPWVNWKSQEVLTLLRLFLCMVLLIDLLTYP